VDKKRAWHFYCVNGQIGVVIMPDEVDANTALIECRLSLGAKVMKVY